MHALAIMLVYCHGLTLNNLRLLQDAVEQVEAEMAERALLGTGKPYERSIP